MDKQTQISICIPAYKNIHFLKRLLDSIAIQTFTDYEVIVTDDSPDNSVNDFIKSYSAIKNIKYFKNSKALGTPENWNEGIRKTNGKWIKIMHDDDWFNQRNALELFIRAANRNPNCAFFFSAFQNVIEDSNHMQVVRCNTVDKIMLWLSPLHLFGKVYVGNPSCTFIRSDVGELYDNKFKFVVDFEYYIRCFKRTKSYEYIDEVLLSIGFNNEQVTKFTFLVPEVQIPENLILLDKLGIRILKNILVYDYYWRMFRNLKIRSCEQISAFYPGPIHPSIRQMLNFQSHFALSILKRGFLSKTLMFISYFKNLLKR